MKVFGFLLACLLITQINGFDRKRCSQRLSQIMFVLCEDKFNSLDLPKRSGLASNAPEVYGSNSIYGNFQYDEGSLTAKKRFLSLEGIAIECCDKPCTIKYLENYCSEVNKMAAVLLRQQFPEDFE